MNQTYKVEVNTKKRGSLTYYICSKNIYELIEKVHSLYYPKFIGLITFEECDKPYTYHNDDFLLYSQFLTN
jgi:hypothetical protein